MSRMSFNQKRRNRAIAITDIAISKVPRTQLPGFTTEQNALIQDLHQQTLRDAQKLNKTKGNAEMEVLRLVDLHSWQDWVVLGQRPCEVITESNPLVKQLIDTGYKNMYLVMHNHPSTGTFSGEDFKTFCNNDSIYIMTVVGNDGCVYVLTKDTNFDSDYAMRAYGKLTQKYQKYSNNATRAMKELLKDASKYNLTYKYGRKKL